MARNAVHRASTSAATTSPGHTSRHRSPADTSQAVDAFLAALTHPCKAEIEAIRRIILSADPSIQEGVKWNVPSFRTTEYFATFHLRRKQGIGLILHLGAKVKDNSGGGVTVEDPARLIQWLSSDRALIVFAGMVEVEAKQSALTAILRQWVKFVG